MGRMRKGCQSLEPRVRTGRIVWTIVEEQMANGNSGGGCKQCTNAARAVRTQYDGYFGELEHTGRGIRTVREDEPGPSGGGNNDTHLCVILNPPNPRVAFLWKSRQSDAEPV